MLSELARIPQVGSRMDFLSADRMNFIDDRALGGRDVLEEIFERPIRDDESHR